MGLGGRGVSDCCPLWEEEVSKSLCDSGGRREGAEETMIRGVFWQQFVWFQLFGELKAVCVCVLFGDGHMSITIKSALDLLSHVYHMLTSIWSRWSDIQSLLSQLWSMMFVWLHGISHLLLFYSTLYSSQKSPPFLPSPFSYFLSLLVSSPTPLPPLLSYLFCSERRGVSLSHLSRGGWRGKL